MEKTIFHVSINLYVNLHCDGSGKGHWNYTSHFAAPINNTGVHVKLLNIVKLKTEEKLALHGFCCLPQNKI